ncbi:MAG: hypothetical protein JWP89_6714 [Schlesneria sp.]|nr:hypothetical protein [Schlesneria sp.]
MSSFHVTVDRRQQVLKLDIPEHHTRYSHTSEQPLAKSLARITGKHGEFACATTLAWKAKCVDDRLYAAVECLTQKGTPQLCGKQALIRRVFFQLLKMRSAGTAQLDESIAFMGAACRLGEDFEFDDDKLRLQVKKRLLNLEQDPFRYHPVGFYSSTPELQAIYRQGRFLQNELDRTQANQFAAAIQVLSLVDQYTKHLRLASRLTNPLVHLGLPVTDDPIPLESKISFYPPSDSPEGRLMKLMFGNRWIPDDFSLVQEMIDRIESGKLSLKPVLDSGWYDYQLYSIESWLTLDRNPEARRLHFEECYRNELRDRFKSFFAFTRETHIKQLEAGAVGCAMYSGKVSVSPNLHIEPLPEYYLRRAESYRFVRELLLSIFVPDDLQDCPVIPELGGDKSPLAELLEIESIFRGAYLIACDEIGLEPSRIDPADARQSLRDVATARTWINSQLSDPDLTADSRCMVPLFYDEGREKTKVVVTLGFRAELMSVAYETRPHVTVIDDNGQVMDQQKDVRIAWESDHHVIASPQSAECYVRQPLSRKEFRRICDEQQTTERILAALSKL